MNKKLFQNKIYAAKSKIHGFGVFADKNFRKGEKIEECYFILTGVKDNDPAYDYVFETKHRRKSALIFGFGCLYNHSDNANADYVINLKTKVATFTADRAIKKGEEIFISYGDEWFSSRDMNEKKPHKSEESK